MQRCPHCNETLVGSLPICFSCGRETRPEPKTETVATWTRPTTPEPELEVFPVVAAAAPAAHQAWTLPHYAAPPQSAAAPQADLEPQPADPPHTAAPQAWQRYQLPILGLGGLAAGFVVLSLMGRPAADAGTVAARTPASPGASVPAPATTALKAEETPSWIFPRRTGYASDGSRTLTLQLSALGDVQRWRQRVRPALAVRCLSRRTDVYVAVGTSVNAEGGDVHGVTVQFDEDPPVKELWLGSASYQELFAPDGFAFAQRLTRARLLRFTFTPYNSRPVAAEFNVQGFNEHTPVVARTCGWPVQKSR